MTEPTAEPLPKPRLIRCEACHGIGTRRAFRPMRRLRTCEACEGRGYFKIFPVSSRDCGGASTKNHQ